jgi:hypothetical protein
MILRPINTKEVLRVCIHFILPDTEKDPDQVYRPGS